MIETESSFRSIQFKNQNCDTPNKYKHEWISGTDNEHFTSTSIFGLKCMDIYTCDEGESSLSSSLKIIYSCL